jgi:hypothetical protein
MHSESNHKVAFGSQMMAFRDFPSACLSLLNVFAVDANFHSLYDNHASSGEGPFMYTIYVVLLLFLVGHLIITLWDLVKVSGR